MLYGARGGLKLFNDRLKLKVKVHWNIMSTFKALKNETFNIHIISIKLLKSFSSHKLWNDFNKKKKKMNETTYNSMWGNCVNMYSSVDEIVLSIASLVRLLQWKH